MSKLDIDAQYELASKIQNLIMFVGLLKDDEIIALREMRNSVEDQISQLGAVAGIITPLEETEQKIAHLKAIIKRTDAVISIHETNVDMKEADEVFEASKKGREQIKELFGL